MFKRKTIKWILALILMGGGAFYFLSSMENKKYQVIKTTSVRGKQADIVFNNGLVHAKNKQEAIAVKNQKIIFIGSDAGAKTYIGKDTKVIDLNGKSLLPGFIDNHTHIFEGNAGQCEMDPNKSLESQSFWLKGCDLEIEPGEWVIGFGSYYKAEVNSKQSTLKTLDEIFPNNPAIIMGVTGHSQYVNSLAYKEAGITKDTPNPKGGIILKDEDGELTGILLDNAGDIVKEIADNSVDRNKVIEAKIEGIEYGMKVSQENGMTTVGDGRTYWRRGWFDAWKQVVDKGGMTTRVSVRPWIYPHIPKEEQLSFLKKIYQNDASGLMLVNQVKMYSDGNVPLGTGKLIEPYEPQIFDEYPHGVNYISEEDMKDWLVKLEAIGFGAHIHGIGDLGIHESLNAIEFVRNEGSQLKYNITHCNIIDRKDIPRFADLDVDADIQLYRGAKNVKYIAKYLGESRATEVLLSPMKELDAAGANVVLSTDYPAGDVLEPLKKISNAVANGDLDIKLAIKAYTINPARALGIDNVTGSLEIGKFADFVILDRDITKQSTKRIGSTKVKMTVLQGDIVYKN